LGVIEGDRKSSLYGYWLLVVGCNRGGQKILPIWLLVVIEGDRNYRVND